MALQTAINFRGVSVPKSYVKILKFEGSQAGMTLHVAYHVAPSNPALEIRAFQMPLNLEGPNPFRQGYIYLKTLPEFQNATDV